MTATVILADLAEPSHTHINQQSYENMFSLMDCIFLVETVTTEAHKEWLAAPSGCRPWWTSGTAASDATKNFWLATNLATAKIFILNCLEQPISHSEVRWRTHSKTSVINTKLFEEQGECFDPLQIPWRKSLLFHSVLQQYKANMQLDIVAHTSYIVFSTQANK